MHIATLDQCGRATFQVIEDEASAYNQTYKNHGLRTSGGIYESS
jgi:hypothetical protein